SNLNSGAGGFLGKSNSSLGFAQVLSGEKEQVIIPSDTVFSVLIPKIGINSRIFPNIDASSSDAFLPVLKQGVAHAQGTFFPGQKGNIYLFAHSVDNFWNVGRYNAIFYLLKNLKAGDDIVVYYQNVRHNYVVKSMGITNPSNVSFIVNSQKEKEVLILQTCWPPGTTWQRLMVFAEPK
ncbi:MAG: sortase, partial [Candidatus Levybacteria bacterium]|nr:sortase [Candidatus Levybacteria bacterium]